MLIFVPFLALARLIVGRDTAVDGHYLSQLRDFASENASIYGKSPPNQSDNASLSRLRPYNSNPLGGALAQSGRHILVRAGLHQPAGLIEPIAGLTNPRPQGKGAVRSVGMGGAGRFGSTKAQLAKRGLRVIDGNLNDSPVRSAPLQCGAVSNGQRRREPGVREARREPGASMRSWLGYTSAKCPYLHRSHKTRSH
jgi:hypothetical protein